MKPWWIYNQIRKYSDYTQTCPFMPHKSITGLLYCTLGCSNISNALIMDIEMDMDTKIHFRRKWNWIESVCLSQQHHYHHHHHHSVTTNSVHIWIFY